MENSKTIFNNRDTNPLESINRVGSFFSGSDPLSFTDIELDPFTTGYSMIYWVKLPFWFENEDDLKYFKVYTQKFMTSFNGFTDVELQESSQMYGFAGNEVSFATGINKNNTDFSIGFKEFSGLPLTNMVDKWITMIRDKNTGISLYPQVYNCEYSARNHTGVLLYISLRPDVTNIGKNNIEKAFLYANVYPVNIPYSALFNYELGSNETPTSIDVNFKGVMLTGKAVNDYAKKVLDEELLNLSEDNNNAHLFLNSLTEAGDPGTELLPDGTVLATIFKKSKD